MAEPTTIYKLIILYMLEQVDFPLTNTKISNFFLDKNYTTYFTVQQVINDLVESELLVFENTHSNTQYRMTASGRETLHFFEDKISDGIRNDVADYFSANQIELKQDADILANYYKATNQTYGVHCQLKQQNHLIVDITLSVKSQEMAEAICENWKKQSEDVYDMLMDMLVK